MKWCGYRVISPNRVALRPLNRSRAAAPHDGRPVLTLASHVPRTYQVRAQTPGQPDIQQKIAAQSREDTITSQSADQC